MSCSHVRVLVYLCGAERETGIGGRGDVGVRCKEGLELALGVQGGGGQQPGVDAHRHLVHEASRVGNAVGRRQDGAGGHRRGQQVGHGSRGDQRPRGGVGQQGGLRVRVGANVGVGPRAVIGAAVRQAEGVPVHRGGDVGLRSAVGGEVPVPLLVAGAKVLHLRRREGGGGE